MKKKKSLLVSILSLSLLTVMAGAAVAPALGVIRRYFSDANPLFVQMIISMPAIFIVITNFLFPRLCKSLYHFRSIHEGGKNRGNYGHSFYFRRAVPGAIFDSDFHVGRSAPNG